MSFLVLFILVLISGGYILLFWSYNKGYISFKGAVISLIVSLAVYLLFPILLGKIEIQSTTLLLFLFVLCGMAAVLFIEEKINPFKKINYNFSESVIKLKDKMSCFRITKGKFFSEGAVKMKGRIGKTNIYEKISEMKKATMNLYEAIIEKLDNIQEPDAEEKTEKFKQARVVPVEVKKTVEPQTDLFKNNIVQIGKEEISYVDFNKKVETQVDLFSSKNIEQTKEVEIENHTEAFEEKEIQSEEVKGTAEEEIELDIEQCIDKAFALKESGKIEEAIEYYIEALEKKPDEQLILWIVVDICSLYKQLGQIELARQTMQSYMETYGANLDPVTKEELLKNI